MPCGKQDVSVKETELSKFTGVWLLAPVLVDNKYCSRCFHTCVPISFYPLSKPAMCGLSFSPWNLRFRRRSDSPNSQNWEVEVPRLRPLSLGRAIQMLSTEDKPGYLVLWEYSPFASPLIHTRAAWASFLPALAISPLFRHLSLQTGLISKNSDIQAFVHLLVIIQMEAVSTAISIVYLLFNLGQVDCFSPLEPLLLHLYFGVRRPIPCWVFVIMITGFYCSLNNICKVLSIGTGQ